jgi:DNA-binding transcriptional MerR regulator
MLIERQTFTIGETAEALSVTPSWLRIAERLGAIPRARRS